MFAVTETFPTAAIESPLDRRPVALRLSQEKTLLDKPVTDLSVTPNILQASILRHLTFTVGKDAPHASPHD